MQKLRSDSQRRNYVRKTKTVFVILIKCSAKGKYEELEDSSKNSLEEIKELIKELRTNTSPSFKYMFTKKRIKLS